MKCFIPICTQEATTYLNQRRYCLTHFNLLRTIPKEIPPDKQQPVCECGAVGSKTSGLCHKCYMKYYKRTERRLINENG